MATLTATLLTLGVLLLVAAGHCSQDPVTANLGSITDDILAGIDTYAAEKNLTTVQLPDVQQDFSLSFWILSLSGRINLTAGTLSNFQKIQRYGGSAASFVPDQNQLVVNTGVALPELKAEYSFQAKMGAVKQRGRLSVSVAGTQATTMLVMTTDTLQPGMLELKVVNLGSINVNIQDGLVGWLVTPIANLVTALLGRTIRDAVETQLPALINQQLDKLDIAGMLKPPADLLPPANY